MDRAEIVSHLERYAAGLAAEVRSATPVRTLRHGPDGSGYVLETDDATIRSRVVVVATGAYQEPNVPAALASLPPRTTYVDVAGYRSPDSLPDGAVLVVGSAQSACQIAEELVLSGREVAMACGKAPWFHRRVEGRDLFDLLLDSPFFEQRTEDLPSPAARHGANVQSSGLGGGHDLHYRTLAALGVRLGGHLRGSMTAQSASPRTCLSPSPSPMRPTAGSATSSPRGARRQAVRCLSFRSRRRSTRPGSSRFRCAGSGLSSLRRASGRATPKWIDIPGIVDDLGFPVHVNGESAVSPGLHFVGVHFLRRRRSSLLFGVGDDAAATADLIASRQSPVP